MKNLLIFLHGKGADQNDKQEFVTELANVYGADILSINAPLAHKQGFKWFNKIDGIVPQSEFSHSLNYVSEIVSKASKDYEKIIFVGHSQGGIIAISAALEFGADVAISLCGDVPQGVLIPQNNYKTKIFWVEGGKDEFLSSERKETYKFFEKNAYQLNYILSDQSSHNGLDLITIPELM
ncbi:MAG: dienelactone hydrolase family protein [Alphaproteobacteria bacterium]|nr:dienelactone hydrolase family protein [Alphaproteobacteria bacterium]